MKLPLHFSWIGCLYLVGKVCTGFWYILYVKFQVICRIVFGDWNIMPFYFNMTKKSIIYRLETNHFPGMKLSLHFSQIGCFNLNGHMLNVTSWGSKNFKFWVSLLHVCAELVRQGGCVVVGYLREAGLEHCNLQEQQFKSGNGQEWKLFTIL